MKQKMKKLLGLSLALFLAFPLLAKEPTKSQIAQEKLENQIYSLLQEGKYEQVKNTLIKIPVCPGDKKVTEKQLPKACTVNKFNPDPFKMKDQKEIDIVINVLSPEDTRFTMPVTLTVVRPVQALKNSLAKQYEERFGKDISIYNKDGYLQFPEPYKGSWLENVIPSFLAQQIWKNVHDYGENDIRAFYNDVKWHEAQGITFDEAAKLKYAGVSAARQKNYNPFNGISYVYLVRFWVYAYMPDIYKDLNDKDFVLNYSRYVYYSLFTMDKYTNFEEEHPDLDIYTYTGKKYAAAILFLFYLNHRNFDYMGNIPMTSNLLKDMQGTVAKYFPEICADPEYMHEAVDQHIIPGFRDYDAKEVCSDFIKYAKEHSLWTDEAEKKYKQLKQEDIQEKMMKAFEENVLYKPAWEQQSEFKLP